MQQGSIPRAPFPTGICEIGSCGSSELWNLRDCNLTRILYETLLLSCVAAFAIGVVIAAASVFG